MEKNGREIDRREPLPTVNRKLARPNFEAGNCAKKNFEVGKSGDGRVGTFGLTSTDVKYIFRTYL